MPKDGQYKSWKDLGPCAVAQQGGTLNRNAEVYVETGSSYTFTITPYAGNMISEVKINGVALPAPVSTYTFTNVNSN